MSEVRCEKHDMVLEYCADCNNVKPEIKDDRPVLYDITVAEYEGVCQVCGDDIRVGDHIGWFKEVATTKEYRPAKVKLWAHYGCGR